MTAYDNWLAAPYTDTDEAQEQLDRACEEVTEDEILAVLDSDNLACAHNSLADSAWAVAAILAMPKVREAILGDSRAHALAKVLESLSVAADTASDEREAAIETCAKKAIAAA